MHTSAIAKSLRLPTLADACIRGHVRHKAKGVSSIYDPQMGKTLARKLESQYVFNK